jgi:SCF-associated factor 1
MQEETLKHKDFKVNEEPAYRQWTNLQRADMFSEWVDQEGSHWKDGPQNPGTPSASGSATASTETTPDTNYENLEPYFAITVAAAGWHSGALVLVDEDKAQEVRQKWIVRPAEDEDSAPVVPGAFESKNDDEEYIWKIEGFPKVELPNGHIMPGVGGLRSWRDGRPSLADLGVVQEQEQ